MSYGGITKGLTAVGSAMILAATRAGVAEALHAELAASQPNLLTYFTRSVPDMFGKAYRWVPEMEEIAHFTTIPQPGRCTRRSPPCTGILPPTMTATSPISARWQPSSKNRARAFPALMESKPETL